MKTKKETEIMLNIERERLEYIKSSPFCTEDDFDKETQMEIIENRISILNWVLSNPK